MSIVFSRSKEKRPRSSGNESNNSFVKNVTSRVSGLLPATITKWFTSPSSSNANGSTPAADVTDSSTEDEATESPVSSQPPAKRMRFSTPGKNNRLTSPDGNSVSRVIESTDTPTLPYNTVQSPPGKNTFRRETNFVSTLIRANEESVVERVEKDTPVLKTQHTVSVIGQSVAKKRKSLFEALSVNNSAKAKTTSNTSRDLKLPYFKPALLGSPFYHGRTMYGGAASSYINQPNIKQKKIAYVKESNDSETATMSHSARRIMDLLENYSSPLTEAKRIPHYVKPKRTEIAKSTTEVSRNSKLNNSLKMQELHVPGIASIMRLKQKSRLMDSTSAARQLMASHSSTSEYKPYPPTSTNKQKDNNNKDTNTNLTTKVKARVTRQLRGDNANEAPPPPVQLPNIVLKIDTLPKFTLEKAVPVSSPALLPPTPPVLPTPPVSSMLAASATSTSLAATSALSPSTITTSNQMSTTGAAISSVFSIPYYITMSPTSTSSSKIGITSSTSPFKFSSPVKVSSETTENCKTPPKFAFGSPDRNIDKPKVDDTKVDSSVVVGSVKETAKILENTNDWKCSECWVSNKPNVDKCVSCGNKREAVTGAASGKCSVCKLANSQPNAHKCVNCENLQSKSIAGNVIKAVNQSQWKCSECWVSNDQNVDKCVCCGANNAKKSASETIKDINGERVWKCFICWVTNENNEANCSSCGNSRNFASFNKPAKCTVCMLANSQPHCNKCANCEKIEQKSVDTGAPKPIEKSQWKCDGCWVNNEDNAENCVCCGANNPKRDNVGAKFAENVTNGDDWKCEECWITNKSHVDKCDTCGGPRPGAKSSSSRSFGGTATSTFKSSDNVFKTIATSQKGSKWECSSCLVRNDDDKTICICCGADREYKTANVGLKPFNFGQITNTSFKFGINTDQQNNNATKMEHTSMGEEVAVSECETNNNVVEKVPTFTFALPTKKSEPSATKENKAEAPKINFNFGIPKQTTELSATNDLFESKKPTEGEQNLQGVPKEDVSVSVPNLIKPIPVLFAPPPAKTSAPTPEILSLLGSENTNKLPKSGLSLSTPNATTSLAEKFSFSASGMKSSMNIFSSPVSNAGSAAGGTSASLFAPPQSAATTTTAATPIALFQKPESTTKAPVTMFTNKEPTATSTISLFQQSNPVTTTASQPVSFFSFGTNSQSSPQPAAEKPKFNFQFGISNNKSVDTPSVFKPTFGSLGDSNANKFSLPTGNILSGGNGLSGNPIGGTNGLSGGNITTGNILVNNNDMSLNPMSGGNGLQTSSSSITGNLFGAPVLKDNIWSNNNNNNNNPATNIFVSNGNTNMMQKPATFTFGSSSPFNANNSTATFGSNTQPTQNIFGMANQNNPQPSVFSSPPANQPAPSVFGSPAQTHIPSQSMGMFGSPNVSATSTFGAMNQPVPSFEATSMTAAPGPAFNFGSSQPSGVFGFGQQQAPQAQQGVYSFGGAGGAAPQVQFNMGSAPNTTQRRVRKAVRRHPQR